MEVKTGRFLMLWVVVEWLLPLLRGGRSQRGAA